MGARAGHALATRLTDEVSCPSPASRPHLCLWTASAGHNPFRPETSSQGKPNTQHFKTSKPTKRILLTLAEAGSTKRLQFPSNQPPKNTKPKKNRTCTHHLHLVLTSLCVLRIQGSPSGWPAWISQPAPGAARSSGPSRRLLGFRETSRRPTRFGASWRPRKTSPASFA